MRRFFPKENSSSRQRTLTPHPFFSLFYSHAEFQSCRGGNVSRKDRNRNVETLNSPFFASYVSFVKNIGPKRQFKKTAPLLGLCLPHLGANAKYAIIFPTQSNILLCSPSVCRCNFSIEENKIIFENNQHFAHFCSKILLFCYSYILISLLAKMHFLPPAAGVPPFFEEQISSPILSF